MARKGTAVDTIEYDKNAVHFRIPLRILKLGDGTFTYRAVNDDPEFTVTNKDPNEVRKQVIALLDNAVTIKWSSWILIECRRAVMSQEGPYGHETDYDDSRHAPTLQGGRELGMVATRWRLGKVNGGDTVFEMAPTLQEDRHAVYRTDTKRCAGTPHGIEFDKETGTWVPNADHALIPDTEENQTKVRSILNSIDILGKRLRLLMAQNRIVETLANVKMLSLPAPTEAPT